MSAPVSREQNINCKWLFCAAIFALILSVAMPLRAQPATSLGSAQKDGQPPLEELHIHAETIAEILQTASDRVEQLAASEADMPMLLNAIRQEISLSRRWNGHLTTILAEVAEARRALGEREREAAREIARMTAVAEEARLELIELKKALTGQPAEAARHQKDGSDSGPGENGRPDAAGQATGQGAILDPMTAGAIGSLHDLDEARASLAFMAEAQASAFDNVDTVRTKIIDALQMLAAAQGDLKLDPHKAGERLSSEDITAWAASIATKIGRPVGDDTD